MKIILPSFYNSYQQNNKIIEKFLFFKNFCGIYGNFPFSIFNGSYNNGAFERLALAEDVLRGVNQYKTLSNLTIIDFGSVMLNESDYYDSFNKVILETYANNKNVFFAIASRKFAKYLTDTYPNIQLIIHQNYTNFCSEEEIKLLIDTYPNNIKYIIITPNNECINIDYPKIYWIPFTLCYCCPQYGKCIKMDNANILEYSEVSHFANCQYKNILKPEYIQRIIKNSQAHSEIIMFDNILLENEDLFFNILNDVLEGDNNA